MKKTNEKGITLIALIITIIVMLILVGVTVNMVVQGGLFKRAGEAARGTNKAITEERMLAEGKIKIDGFWYDSMQDYLAGICSADQPNAVMQFTYSLNPTQSTKGTVAIMLTVNNKNYKEYEDYGREILDKMNEEYTNEEERIQAKETLLLEGINWLDTNEDYYRGNGESFESLQEFVEWSNEDWETEYVGIYDLMQGELEAIGVEVGDTEEETLENFLLQWDWFINPEEYYDYDDKNGEITITKPDNTTEAVWNEDQIVYQVSQNGNYTFKASNKNGDKGAITVRVENIEGKFSDKYNETKKYTDKNGKTAWIPKGFAVSTWNGENTIDGGLVITDKVDANGDSIGNEFVWVPVEDGELNRTDFGTGVAFSGCSETLPSELRASILTHKGFYVGRYEAGTEEPRYYNNGGTVPTGPITANEVVIKPNVYPYNFVAYVDTNEVGSGAVTLSNGMYPDNESNETGVVSHLIYGAEWDEMLNYIADDAHNVTDSTNWGNYHNTQFICNPGTKYGLTTWNSIQDKTGVKLLTTGTSKRNKVKNIYDIAGNVQEWTHEAGSVGRQITRGGDYSTNFNPSASYRVSTLQTNKYQSSGFRPALYIK